MRPSESIALRREPGHIVRSMTALLLRVGLGLIFLTAGLDKLSDIHAEAEAEVEAEPEAEVEIEGAVEDEVEAATGAEAETEAGAEAVEPAPRYPETIRSLFADTWLARDFGPALELHTEALPYVEVAVGALLILGLLTTLSAFVAGLLLLSLLFGLMVLGNSEMYANMMVYLVVDSAILWLSPITSNYLSLDGLLFGWFWKPKSEGEYRREYEAPPR